MDYIEVKGSHYEVGTKLGLETKHALEIILNDFKNGLLYPKIKEFVSQQEGRQVVDNFRKTVQTYFGHYLQELKGLADGACVSFDDLFLLAINHEFSSIWDQVPGSSHDVIYTSLYDGCTNISMESDDGQLLLAHNEDIPLAYKGIGVMVKVLITNPEGKVIEDFVDFYLPGLIFGSRFGFNSHGVMMAHNNIIQHGINLNGIPRRFMCRALCSVRNGTEAKRILETKPGMATSFSFQFVQRTNGGIENTVVEVANSDTERLVTSFKPRGFYHHCNILQHLNYPCHPNESSVHRAAVLSQYVNRGERFDKRLICRAISNTHDPTFPVYRNGDDPDYLVTSSTGIFDVNKGTLEVYTDKPSETSPVHVFNIPHKE